MCLRKPLIHLIHGVKLMHNTKHFKHVSRFKASYKAYLVLHEATRSKGRLFNGKPTGWPLMLLLSKLVTCCLHSHTATAANWWKTRRIKRSLSVYVRGGTPHRGREVSLALYWSTRTGRWLATTSCDDTCIHALNIQTIKNGCRILVLFWKLLHRCCRQKRVCGDELFNSRSSHFVLMWWLLPQDSALQQKVRTSLLNHWNTRPHAVFYANHRCRFCNAVYNANSKVQTIWCTSIELISFFSAILWKCQWQLCSTSVKLNMKSKHLDNVC